MNELIIKREMPKGKAYITTYLPGDVMHASDGSVGLIVQVRCIINSGIWAEWNYRWDNSKPLTVTHETYRVDVIPGWPCSKLAWWSLKDFTEVLKGPLHEVLGGNKFERPEAKEVERLSAPRHSFIAPFGRGVAMRSTIRKELPQ